MSTAIKQQRNADQEASSRVSPPRLKSDPEIAKEVLDQQLPDPDPLLLACDKEAFDAFHMEMKEMHRPHLPVHFYVVERATELRWRLRKINAWENQLFRAMARALDPERPASPNMEKLTQFLDMLFRHNALDKIAKYEAAVRDQVRKSDQDLREIADWFILTGLKRGDIGYTVSHSLYRENPERLEPDAPEDSRKDL